MQLGAHVRAELDADTRAAVEIGEIGAASAASVRPRSGQMADPDYRRLWDALGHDMVPMDMLVARTGLTAPAVSSMLIIMELDGLVTVGANGRYGRAGRKSE
jgi:DNA processing protein